jgi:hypothetical protein
MLPLLELGLATGLTVVKETIRADGRLRSTSIWGSGDEAEFAGRLDERRRIGFEGVKGIEDAMMNQRKSLISHPRITMVV